MLKRTTLLLVALTLAACDADLSVDDERIVEEVQESADLGTGGPSGSASDLPERHVRQARDLGNGQWSLDVPAEAVSMLLVAAGTGIDDLVTLVDLTAPDGTRLGDTIAFPDNGGEVSLLLPRHPDEALQGGTYVVELASDFGVGRVEARFKYGDVLARQSIDVTLLVVTDHPDLAPSEREHLADLLLDAGAEALTPHGLAVGELAFVDAPPELIDRHADLELPTTRDDLAQRELCAAMDGLASSDTLHVAIVDRVVDPDDDEGETEGNAAGIPGAAGLEGTSTSCVVVIADGSRSIFDMPEVVWHEAGHLLGLPHTTESSGDAFDFFLDTAECDVDLFDLDGDEYLDADECVDADGDNLMFHDGNGVTLSEEQAWLLRHHPLFHG